MSLSEVKAIAVFGMERQKLVLEVAGLNISNANQVKGSQEGFKVFEVSHSVDVDDLVKIDSQSISLLPEGAIVGKEYSPRVEHNPDHPLSDARGYIYKSKIDSTNEMINSIEASRAYEANLRIYNSAINMEKSSLKIGGN